MVDIDNPESIDWHHPEEHIMDIRADSSDWQYDGCEIVGFVPGEEEWVVNDVDDVQEILDNLRKIKSTIIHAAGPTHSLAKPSHRTLGSSAAPTIALPQGTVDVDCVLTKFWTSVQAKACRRPSAPNPGTGASSGSMVQFPWFLPLRQQ